MVQKMELQTESENNLEERSTKNPQKEGSKTKEKTQNHNTYTQKYIWQRDHPPTRNQSGNI